jgi:hypothetical protein
VTSEPVDFWETVATVAAALPNAVRFSLSSHFEFTLRAKLDVGDSLHAPASAFRIGANDSRLFTFALHEGNHAGVYLRSLDPKLGADPRFSACSGVGGVPTNWVRLSRWEAGLTGEELYGLLVESHRLTLTRNEGVPPRTAFGDVHAILLKALNTAAAEERPTPPFHAGGPMPKLPGAGAFRVAIACGEHVAKLVPEAQRDEYDRVLAAARRAPDVVRAVDAQPTDREPLYEYWRTLEKAAKSRPKDALAVRAARRAAGAALSLAMGKPDMVGQNALLAAERAVQALHEAGDGAGVRAFIEALDDWILVEEILSIDPDVSVRRVLWRAANEKGFAAAWLVRFEDDSYGLRHKVKSRFVWVRGSRDDVLASVPDRGFQLAVAFAFERDVSG